MTQQYIVGEFSALLAELQSASGELFANAVGNLRHEVEFGLYEMLPHRAREAMTLTDVICRSTLEHRDMSTFRRCTDAAAALREFAASANLVP